jgi:D-amino-acid oxidase
MAHDNGRLEAYDRATYHHFGSLIDGKSVYGCRALKAGEGNDVGLGRMGMWAIFDAPIAETGIVTEETGKVWYDELVGGLRELGKEEMQGRGEEEAVWGMEVKRTYRFNTQVYLQWYGNPLFSFSPSYHTCVTELNGKRRASQTHKNTGSKHKP